jgi:hypothetical protein
MIHDLGLPAGPAAGSASRQRATRAVLELSAHPAAPAFCLSKARPDSVLARISHSPDTTSSSQRATHIFNANWAGYGVTQAESGGSGINGVTGVWTVGTDSTNGSPGAELTWIGIGGANGEANPNVWGLIQAGTSMETDYGYQAWFEYVGSDCPPSDIFCDPKWQDADAVRPGDVISTEVTWVSTTEACFDLADFTHGVASFSTCLTFSSVNYDHTSAEWVNENFLGKFWCPPADDDEDCDPFAGRVSGREEINSYDNPGDILWTDQQFTHGFNGSGTWQDPFSGSYESFVMMTPDGSASGTPDCTNSSVLSFPENPITRLSSGGSSDIWTCQDSWDS